VSMAGVITHRWRSAGARGRAWMQRTAGAGLLAGAVATAAYDASRFALSRLDPSPYDPFDVIRIFGRLLAGPSAAPTAVVLSGAAFHVFNGLSFAVAFAFLLGHRGALAGMAWGLGLEGFQLALYPDWLDLRLYYVEFARISAASHVVYGIVLGACCHRAMGDAVSVRLRAEAFLRSRHGRRETN
jgi:hypothetical protein